MGGCASADKGTMKINKDGPVACNAPIKAEFNINCDSQNQDSLPGFEEFADKFNADLGDDLNSSPIWGDLSELMFEREQDEDYHIKDEASLWKQGFTADLFKPDIVKKLATHLGEVYKAVVDKHGAFKIRPVEFKELLVDESKLEVRKCQKHGEGLYFGQWNTDDNNPEGRGIMVYQNGTIYEGLWLRGMRHGSGRFILILDGKSAVYQGNWVGDSTDGCYGYFASPSGVTVKGRWEDHALNGDGFETDTKGNSYRGEYQNGVKNGKGACKWDDGNTYEGDLANNNMTGTGLLTYKDGRTYEGGYNENKMHGEGKFEWKGGKKYTGGYSNNQKHGQGKFDWGDGQSYNGGWSSGKQHGEGLFVNKEGVAKKGKWDNGKLEKWI